MTYIALAGAIFALILVITFFVIRQPQKSNLELSWKKCIWIGSQIYVLSLFLGSFTTSLVLNASREDEVMQYIVTTFLQTFVMFLYAVIFSLLIVLPALVLGLKALSKTSLTGVQKMFRFVSIAFGLVFLVNFIMTDFFTNPDFLIFLMGFSVFGVAIPWLFVKYKKVFE